MLISEIEEESSNTLDQDKIEYEIQQKIQSNNSLEIGEGLEGMKLILKQYTQDQVDLDKIDITLLRGIYKDDPNANDSESSLDSKPAESLSFQHDEPIETKICFTANQKAPNFFT